MNYLNGLEQLIGKDNESGKKRMGKFLYIDIFLTAINCSVQCLSVVKTNIFWRREEAWSHRFHRVFRGVAERITVVGFRYCREPETLDAFTSQDRQDWSLVWSTWDIESFPGTSQENCSEYAPAPGMSWCDWARHSSWRIQRSFKGTLGF